MSKFLHTNQVREIFKFRTRMSNVKANFKSKYQNIGFLCPLDCGQFENDKHLINCSKTKNDRSEVKVNFEKLFNGNNKDLGVLIDVLTNAEKVRDSLLEKKMQS